MACLRRCVLVAGTNVLRLQKFIFRENFLFRRSCGQKVEDILDAQPVAPNARTPPALASLDGNTIKEIFAHGQNIAFLRENREPEASWSGLGKAGKRSKGNLRASRRRHPA